MGVQEIIWNYEAWWSGSRGTVRYSACFHSGGPGDHLELRAQARGRHDGHRDHTHIGISWRGAAKRTTVWTRGR